MPGGPLPGPRFGEMTRLSAPTTAAEGGPGTARAPGPAKAGHSPRTQDPWGRPQGRRVSIPQRLETDRKQTGSLGVTAGFLFPQRQRRFPGKGSRSGNATKGLPFLPPRRRQGRRGRPVGCGPGGSGRSPSQGQGPSRRRRRPVTRPRQRPP